MPKIFIDGSAGKIEGMYHQSEDAKSPVALVLHPHPLYGGTMNNKITYHLYKAFIKNNFTVCRINFRGVGDSQGQFDNGEGELTDIGTALDWLRVKNSNASHFWVSGFSFGAWIAMQTVMRRPEVESFVVAAPPASRYNFGFFSPCPVSGLIIQGSEDKITDPDETKKLVDSCQRKQDIALDYSVVEGADHFFSEYLADFDSIVNEYIAARVDSRTVKPIVKQRKRSKNKRKTATTIASRGKGIRKI